GLLRGDLEGLDERRVARPLHPEAVRTRGHALEREGAARVGPDRGAEIGNRDGRALEGTQIRLVEHEAGDRGGLLRGRAVRLCPQRGRGGEQEREPPRPGATRRVREAPSHVLLLGAAGPLPETLTIS